jgi:cell division protein FtsB
MKAVHYEMLPILTLEGVRELKVENDALREQVAALQQENASTQARLAAIEQRLTGGTAPLVAAR